MELWHCCNLQKVLNLVESTSVVQGGLCHCCALQEATDIYKALLLDNRELLALNVYVALCYAKLDYYDVSQEILQVSERDRASAAI